MIQENVQHYTKYTYTCNICGSSWISEIKIDSPICLNCEFSNNYVYSPCNICPSKSYKYTCPNSCNFLKNYHKNFYKSVDIKI